MAHGVAVRAERGRSRIDLLDAPVPEVAAVVHDMIALELLDPQLYPERMAAGGQTVALEGAEDAVGIRLEGRGVAVGALRDRSLRALLVRDEALYADQLGQPHHLRIGRLERHTALAQQLVAHARLAR